MKRKYTADIEGIRKAVEDHAKTLDQLRQANLATKAAVQAFEAIFDMAHEYAMAGGLYGPEMEVLRAAHVDYDVAVRHAMKVGVHTGKKIEMEES